jgi:hypothetical protein
MNNIPASWNVQSARHPQNIQLPNGIIWSSNYTGVVSLTLETADSNWTAFYELPFLVLTTEALGTLPQTDQHHSWLFLGGWSFIEAVALIIYSRRAIYAGSVLLRTSSSIEGTALVSLLDETDADDTMVSLPSPKKLVDVERVTCQTPTSVVQKIVTETLQFLETKNWTPLRHAPGFQQRVRRATINDKTDLKCQTYIYEILLPPINSSKTSSRDYANRAYEALPNDMKTEYRRLVREYVDANWWEVPDADVDIGLLPWCNGRVFRRCSGHAQ